MNALGNADALVEADQIGATTEEHVLAVVDDFVDARMAVGTGAAAKIAAALDKLDAEPGFGQRAGGTHARHSPADHGRRFVWDYLGSLKRSSAPQMYLSYDRRCRSIAACSEIVAHSSYAPKDSDLILGDFVKWRLAETKSAAEGERPET